MPPRTWSLRQLLLTGVILLHLPIPARGLQFVLNYDYVHSATYIDPCGVDRTLSLILIMESAAARWEQIIQDEHTLTINYRWEDIDDSKGWLGYHLLSSSSGGRETEAKVVFDTRHNGQARPWWLDPTPADDSEFSMYQALYRDLSVADQTAYFDGSPPGVFEAGYRGGATASAPYGAREWHDMLSSAVHEIGHGLGLTDPIHSSEAGDNDYDVYPLFVGGATMACNCYASDNKVHLADLYAAMQPGLGTGARVLPSQADVFASAAVSYWSDIHLSRKEWVGAPSWAGSWSDQSHWIGYHRPTSDDDVFIRHADADVILGSYHTVANLTLDSGAKLSIDPSTGLTVTGLTAVYQADTELVVNNAGELDTHQLWLAGHLRMYGGDVTVEDQLIIYDGGRINGRGTVEVGAYLRNDNVIRADGGGTLTLTTSNTGQTFDLDGLGGTGKVHVVGANLSVDGRVYPFGGYMIVYSGHTATLSDDWQVTATGTVRLYGGSLSGGEMDVYGKLDVDPSGSVWCPVIFRSTADVEVDSGCTLRLYGETTYAGADVGAGGRIRQYNNVAVTDSTTLNLSLYEWDGGGGGTITTIHPGKSFTINADRIADADPAADGFDGTVHVDGATLTVNTTEPWRLDGTMNLAQSGSDTPHVHGSDMVVYGSIAVTGEAYIHCGADFQSTANVSLPGPANKLEVMGDIKYRGCLIAGSGRFVQSGDAEVLDDTTIEVDVFDWDGGGTYSATTVAQNVSFTINSDQVDAGDPAGDGFDGTVNVNGGTLAVNTADPWRLDGTMHLTETGGSDPHVNGQQIVVHGSVSASGRCFINAPVKFKSSAAVSVPGAGDELWLTGDVTYQGGSFTGDGTIVQNSDAVVEADTTIGAATYCWDGSFGPATRTTVEAGVTFTIDSDRIDDTDPVTDGYDGTVTVAGVLAVNTSGAWRLDGTMDLQGGRVEGQTIRNYGLLGGHGEVAATALTNNGTIAPDGGTLTLDTDMLVDLDGATGDGIIDATSGSLQVNVGMTDLFDGEITVGTGQSVTFATGWTLNTNGLLRFQDASTDAVVASAMTTALRGEVRASGEGTLDGDVRFDGSCIVWIPDLYDKLRVTGLASLWGGAYTGLGTLSFDGDVHVLADTDLQVRVLDWDGLAPFATTTIDPGVRLDIHADRIDTVASDGFDGTVDVNGGTLGVYTDEAWALDGTMNLTETGGSIPVVEGSDLIVKGSIHVSGAASIEANTDFRPGSEVSLPNASDRLVLGGITTYGGGTIGLAGEGGTIVQGGDANVTGDATIGASLYDWDGPIGNSTTTIQPGAGLTIQSARIDEYPGTDGFDGAVHVNGGVLGVHTSGPWRLDGAMHLTETSGQVAIVEGSDMIVNGSINALGQARIDAATDFHSTATVASPTGATLVLGGATAYRGGSYLGSGTLRQVGDATVWDDTDIDVGVFDWDGNETSTTTVKPGVVLRIRSDRIDPDDDTFDGTVNVGSGGGLVVDTTDPWTLGGTMNLSSEPDELVTVTGSPIVVTGTIHHEGYLSHIIPDVEFRSSADVTVENGPDTLRLKGDVVFRGGRYRGDGTLALDADATVRADTGIGVATFDWDGASEAGRTTINPGVRLEIGSDRIDSADPLVDGYDGVVDINGGVLAVLMKDPWRLDGTMNLTETKDEPALVEGSRMLVFGSVNVSGEAAIASDVEFIITSAVNLPAALDVLALDGATRYAGGAVGGTGQNGTLVQNGDAQVAEDTTIRLGTYDWDGREAAPSAMVLEVGVDLTIEADAVDRSAGDGYDGTVTVGRGALLTVNTPHPWRLDGEMHLAGGSVGGSEIHVQGVLSGSGRVDTDGLDNCGEVAADGGKLSLSTASFPDLDGSTGHGTVSALDGDVEVRTDPGGLFTFRGRLTIGGGHTFAMRDDGLANEGLMELAEGEYVAPRLEHRRIMTVGEGTSRLVTGAVFAAGSETTIEGELAIAGSGEVEAGASITGAGTLVVEAAARLWAEGTIDVNVLNAGWLAPGTSAGTLALSGDYRQEETGTLQVELEGAGPDEIDLLAVGRVARLDGVLELDPGASFDPDYGDKFVILTADRLSGRFDLITGIGWSPETYLAVLYDDRTVTVVAALPGDINIDGNVDFLDYITLKRNLGTPRGAAWIEGDLDGDGRIGRLDFLIFTAHFGCSVGTAKEVVPEPAALSLLALGGLAVLKRRRKP